MNIIQDAAFFAGFHHGSQRYGAHCHSVHLEAVAQVLSDAGIDDPELIACAWLHDVLEDTDADGGELTKQFGADVYAVVFACTGVGPTRKDRNASIYAKVAEYPRAAIVKVADRIANVEHSAPGSRHRSMYQNERAAFWNGVARFAPKQLQDRLDAAYEKE